MRKHFSIFLLMTMGFLSCTKERNLSFKIENNSSSQIYVQYVVDKTPGILTAHIYSSQTRIMRERTFIDSKTLYWPNWFYQHDFSIKSIVNQLGDTLNFDADVAQYWQYEVGEVDSYYSLSVNDTCF